MTELIVTEEGFPHGVQCLDCGLRLTEGMPYSQRLEGLASNGWPIVEIVCVLCGLGLNEGSP